MSQDLNSPEISRDLRKPNFSRVMDSMEAHVWVNQEKVKPHFVSIGSRDTKTHVPSRRTPVRLDNRALLCIESVDGNFFLMTADGPKKLDLPTDEKHRQQDADLFKRIIERRSKDKLKGRNEPQTTTQEGVVFNPPGAIHQGYILILTGEGEEMRSFHISDAQLSEFQEAESISKASVSASRK